MKKITIILFVVAFCIYLYNTKPELVSKIINKEPFEDEILTNPKVILKYKPHNSSDTKYWDINDTNYGLLDDGFINMKYDDMIKNKELGNDIISPTLVNYEDEEKDIIIEQNKDTNDTYPPKSYYYNNKNYILFGLGSNPYYNIYLIIYERELNSESNIHNNKLYEYILIKKQHNSINVIQVFQPRNKISFGEYINLSFGPSELTYILVSQIN